MAKRTIVEKVWCLYQYAGGMPGYLCWAERLFRTRKEGLEYYRSRWGEPQKDQQFVRVTLTAEVDDESDT